MTPNAPGKNTGKLISVLSQLPDHSIHSIPQLESPTHSEVLNFEFSFFAFFAIIRSKGGQFRDKATTVLLLN